jgi:AcrR family transcriptional regulator
MSGEIIDRRIQKTRRLLQDSLIELVSEKGFESVTIQDIVDRANVGRSTFYTHFQDKNELLQSCFDQIGKLFELHNAHISNGGNVKDFHNARFLLNIFQFVEKNHKLFKALLGKPGIGTFNQPIYDYIFDYMYEAARMLTPRDKQNSYQPEMAAHYYVSAFIGTIRWWLDKDMPCSAEELDTFFKQLAIHGFRDIH